MTPILLGYLDPGAGSLALQAALAGAAGVVMVLRLVWRAALIRVGLARPLARSEDAVAADR